MKGLTLLFLLVSFFTFAQPQPVTPEQFGADNDSTTRDDLAIMDAVNAAGPHGTLVFKPGTIYLAKNSIKPLPGQTWIGYGATIKHADEITTTTTTAIVAGTPTNVLSVASTTGFEAGMRITVTTGPNMINGCYVGHYIIAVDSNNNTITVSNAFTKSFPNGGTVVTNYGVINVAGKNDDVKILGLEIDGNRNNNRTYCSWQTNGLITINGDHVVIRDCRLQDGQSDGIMLGGTGAIADNNYIERMGGNGIHLSGLTNGKIINNYIYYCTLSITGTDNNSGPGHAEGTMTWSNLISNTLIQGNHMGYARAMLGVIDGTDNNDNIISHNFFENAYLYGIEFKYGSGIDDNSLKNLILTENKWKNCAKLYFNNNGSSNWMYGSANRNFIVSSNLFDNTTIEVVRGKDFQLVNNTFDQHGDSTSLVSIDIYYSSSYIVSQNIINYGLIGIRISPGGPYVGTKFYIGGEGSIDNNRLRDQSAYGIYTYGTYAYEYQSLDIFRNSIVLTCTNRNNYIGIFGANGVTLEKNRLLMSSGKYGIQCMGDAVYTNYGTNGTVAKDNYVNTPVGVPSFKISGGTGSNIIDGNRTTQPISNSQPANNTVTDNVIIN